MYSFPRIQRLMVNSSQFSTFDRNIDQVPHCNKIYDLGGLLIKVDFFFKFFMITNRFPSILQHTIEFNVELILHFEFQYSYSDWNHIRIIENVDKVRSRY